MYIMHRTGAGKYLMDSDVIYLILCICLPALAAVVTYFVCNKNLDKAKEAMKRVQEILAFYDPEHPRSESYDAWGDIIKHPKSYCMEEDEIQLVYSTCKDLEEQYTVSEMIKEHEDYMDTDYVLTTSGAVYRVYYGSPIRLDESKFKRLSLSDINTICDITKGADTFYIMNTILQKERDLVSEYDIPLGNCTVHIKDGTFSVTTN